MKVFLSNKVRWLLLIYSILIIFSVINMLNWYLSSLTPKIEDLIVAKLEKTSYEIITNKINTDLINEKNLKDVLYITKNSQGEILTVDYNLEKAYQVNNMINNSVRTSLTNLEYGSLNNSEFIQGKSNIYIMVPMLINTNYIILSSLGPKIPIKISFIGNVITNLKTLITSYGMNNVLNEVYVTVEITLLVTSPVHEKEIKINYEILIDATMINGRVPTFYGSEIIKESSILDIPIE